MRLAYYPGCTLKTQAKNFEISAIATLSALGVEMVEIPRWNCCGVVFSLATDDLMHLVAPIRNLVRAEEMSSAISHQSSVISNQKEQKSEDGKLKTDNCLVVLCSMCYNTLKRSNILVKQNPDHLKKINDFMNLENDYQGNVEVIHFLEILKDIGFKKIAEKVKKPLKGLRVSPYYGCMMLRPKDVGIDDPEDPTIQAELLGALGAETIDCSYKTRCCGSFQTVQDKYAVGEMAYDILTSFQDNGADTVVLSCPLCAFNLDSRQREVKEKHPNFVEVPVLYFTQLMALAYALGDEYYGFDYNYIDPRPLLKKKNLL